jgi:SepF-like predicted cell division protein (DUF552 family)
MNWPKYALKNKNADENREENDENKKDPLKLLFTIKNPDFPKVKEVTERNETPKDLSLKKVGASIFGTMMKPLDKPRLNAAPKNESLREEETITVEPLEKAEEIESPEERQAETSVVQTSGVRDMENAFIPEHGEIIVINVGPADQKKQLFAVSRKRSSIVVSGGDKGNDFIEVKKFVMFKNYFYKNLFL